MLEVTRGAATATVKLPFQAVYCVRHIYFGAYRYEGQQYLKTRTAQETLVAVGPLPMPCHVCNVCNPVGKS